MKIIDTKGTLCPAPIILTKRAIKQATQGEELEILLDNDIAVFNLLSYLKEMGIDSVQSKSGDVVSIRFVVGGEVKLAAQHSSPEQFCSIPTSNIGQYSVVIKSLTMGEGDSELGELLMRSCVNSLAELDSLPKYIILYNNGVKLAISGSDTSQALKNLEDAGVEIIICGACVDYYQLKEMINIGTISNMYKINTVVSNASHVVYP